MAENESINLILPDGSVKKANKGATAHEVALSIGPGLARDAVVAKLDGSFIDLTAELDRGGHFSILTFDDPEGREVYRHSVAHVLAQAVKRLYSDVQLGIGPAIDDGFYYDFDMPHALSEGDLQDIEQEMEKIVAQDLPFEQEELSRQEAIDMFEEMDEPYKVELISEMQQEAVSIYRLGEFVDLCSGPHLPSTGRIEAFKLLNVAGAYWLGDENRPQLQRIYGTAFDSASDLAEHIDKLQEAERRDHRRLGKKMDLFSLHPQAGPGLIYWHPQGYRVREVIEGFWRDTHRERGYEIVSTPHIAREDLWETSGHLETFSEDMFDPMDVDGIKYLLKPMNCPFHIMIYQSEMRSYRELPLRWAEMGTVYRYERSGVLHGLLRVRGFTQDDAHIFCRPGQVEEEIIGVVRLAQYMLSTFGYDDYSVKLSVRNPENPEEYIGDEETWDQAEGALARALDRIGLDYTEEVGEAKFYGPAIDIEMQDALGRGWQGPTIQLDFNLPQRFDMTYIGSDGDEHRPVMIHRTVLGSMERFFGGLIEHYAGAFPPWLASIQVQIIPVSEDHLDYAAEIQSDLSAHGVRAEVDDRNEKVGYKIRSAEVQKIPYMLVVGDREIAQQTVSLRTRNEGDLGPREYSEFRENLLHDIQNRYMEPSMTD